MPGLVLRSKFSPASAQGRAAVARRARTVSRYNKPLATLMPVDQVSDFDAADTDELILMWRESFEHAMGIRDPNPLDQQRAYFEAEIRPKTRVQVVKRHGKLVAFLAAHERYLAQLYVRFGFSGQGIGSMLLRLAQEQSSGSLSLHTLAKNERACRFYEQHGFQAVGFDYESMWQLESVEYRWCGSQSAA